MNFLPALAQVVILVLLLWPIRSGLTRARWTRGVPRLALTAWCAWLLAVALSWTGSWLAIATAPLGGRPGLLLRNWLTGSRVPWHRLGAIGLAGAAIAALSLTVMAVAAERLVVRARSERRSLAAALSVVAEFDPTIGAYLVPGSRPFAYSLLGRDPMIVLSTSALDRCSAVEVEALIEHERAHLSGRHELIRLPFTALAGALPWATPLRVAQTSVHSLTEVLADMAAARAVGRRHTLRALHAMATPSRPEAESYPIVWKPRAEEIGRVRSLLTTRENPATMTTASFAVTLLLFLPFALLFRS